MIYTIAVHGSPYAGTSHHHALQFARAVCTAGHSVNRVFFYFDGVYVALGSRVVPQDEGDNTQAWRSWAQEHEVELAVCIANGLKRGVLDDSEAQRYEIEHPTLADGFTLVGLGQLIDAIAQADRYIEFPA